MVLSGYPSDLYESRLQGWNRAEFRNPRKLRRGNSVVQSVEVLWSNRPWAGQLELTADNKDPND
ncbi:MAG: hypothetical protein V3W44_10875 [Dehalococcoidales bacterium]